MITNIIVGVLTTLLGGAIIVIIKQWSDTQILKDWRQSHTTEHAHSDILMHGTIEKIFTEIKEISKAVNTITGKCDKCN